MLNIPRKLPPDIEDKVDFLSAAASYPERPRTVEVRETHMSWVFLTDRHAFKLKKPVKTSFLDFSTLERRRRFCEEEVGLNRNLAPGIYIGVVPLGFDFSLGFRFGEGEPVDFLVQMVRLPDVATLEHQIRAGAINESDVHDLAARLAAFYRDARTVRIGTETYCRRHADDIKANAEALLRPIYGLPKATVETVARALNGFLATHGEELARRAHERRIVDAHGDLRPEHIYFLPDGIVVIDRLEFNPAFRELDPVEELGYLAMECDRAGAPSVGPWLFGTYASQTGDKPSERLIAFYKCSRAMLRAKLAIWHLDSPRPRIPEKWPRQARAYLALARNYAESL